MKADMNITGPWLSIERHVFCDNLFISVPLAEELLLQHITIVGTLLKNKTVIPREMQPAYNYI